MSTLASVNFLWLNIHRLKSFIFESSKGLIGGIVAAIVIYGDTVSDTECQIGHLKIGNVCIDMCEGIDCGIGGSCLSGNCTCQTGFTDVENFCEETCALTPCQELIKIPYKNIDLFVFWSNKRMEEYAPMMKEPVGSVALAHRNILVINVKLIDVIFTNAKITEPVLLLLSTTFQRQNVNVKEIIVEQLVTLTCAQT